MAISGVYHHDLCNMHNYMSGNMAACSCFIVFHTIRYGGVHFTYYTRWDSMQDLGQPNYSVLIYTFTWSALEIAYVTSSISMPTSPQFT